MAGNDEIQHINRTVEGRKFSQNIERNEKPK
jgi:hypothetical protein